MPNEILSKQEKAPGVIKDNTAESKNSVSIKNVSTEHHQRSLSLNHTPSEDDGINSSFSKSIRKEQASKDIGNDVAKDLEEAKLDAEVDTKEEQVVTKKKDITTNNESIGHLTRKEYLKQASKKYYFKDSSLPSFRLFEHEDDNDKYIEEQELWRPLGANSQNEHENNESEQQLIMQKETGNCSSNKEQKKYKNEEPQQLPLENNQTQEKSSYVFSPPKVPTPPYKPMSPLSNSEHTRRINIAGKRLFQDDFDSLMSTNKNLKQPMSTEVEFLYERSNATSPKVQFLGERSNKVPESSPEV